MSEQKNKCKVIGLAASLSVLLIAPVSATAGGEENDGGEGITRNWFVTPMGGDIYFLGGVGFFDTDPLDERLIDNGYSDLESPFVLLGGGFTFRMGFLLMSLEGNGAVNFENQSLSNDLRMDTHGGYWLARIGVDVIKWSWLSVYPIVGIGTSHLQIEISDERGDTFDSFLVSPRREVEMSQMGLLIDTSLGVDYRLWMTDSDYRKTYMLFGVRAGYLFSVYDANWRTEGAEILGGPDSILTGPVVQLVIGFSSDMKKMYPRSHYK